MADTTFIEFGVIAGVVSAIIVFLVIRRLREG